MSKDFEVWRINPGIINSDECPFIIWNVCHYNEDYLTCNKENCPIKDEND